jgi:hypothetical protein
MIDPTWIWEKRKEAYERWCAGEITDDEYDDRMIKLDALEHSSLTA